MRASVGRNLIGTWNNLVRLASFWPIRPPNESIANSHLPAARIIATVGGNPTYWTAMKPINRRTASAVLMSSFSAALNLASFKAYAQNYPTKAIRVIVPWTAGGSTDVLARSMADHLGKQFQQSMVVDNRPGAAGTIGTASVVRSDPDGYTLLFGTNSTFAIAPYLYPGLPYDHMRDLTPIVLVGATQQVLCVNPALGIRDLKGLVDYLHANPDKVTFASSGNGGSSHLATEMLMAITKTKMLHVPYKAGAPALQSILGNETNVAFVDLSIVIPQLRAGRLVALGTSGTNRSPSLPEVPTLNEAGAPGFASETSFGVFAPKGIQADKVQMINAAINRWLKEPETVAKMRESGNEARGGTPAALVDYARGESEKWGALIKARGIKVE